MSTVKTPPRVITDRTTIDRYDAPHRHLERGDEVTVTGVQRKTSRNPDGRGRCAFVAYTTHVSGAEWLDVIHGKTGRSRTVRPDAVVVTHHRRTGILAVA